MYQPAQFAVTDIATLHALMQERPLATLVTSSSGGLDANHIPLLFSATQVRGECGMLRGHIARANPLHAQLQSECDALAIFHGPDAYVSQSYYATKAESGRVVPTWNYATVHAYERMRLVEDARWLRQLLDDLTHQHESRFTKPWSVDDAPRDYVETLLGAIVGIEITVTRLEGKWKVSQNQPARNIAGVIDGLRAAGADDMSALVAERAPRDCREG
jgi:transcriptional regulator